MAETKAKARHQGKVLNGKGVVYEKEREKREW
jgi:hypothetical protein